MGLVTPLIKYLTYFESSILTCQHGTHRHHTHITQGIQIYYYFWICVNLSSYPWRLYLPGYVPLSPGPGHNGPKHMISPQFTAVADNFLMSQHCADAAHIQNTTTLAVDGYGYHANKINLSFPPALLVLTSAFLPGKLMLWELTNLLKHQRGPLTPRSRTAHSVVSHFYNMSHCHHKYSIDLGTHECME